MNALLPKKAINIIETHIKKIRTDDDYKVKTLVAGAVILDAATNGADSFHYLKDKNVPEEKRKYVSAYKLANAIITCSAEFFVGFAVTNKKFQEQLSNKLFGEFKKTNPEMFAKCSIGLKTAVSVLLATVLVKRILVPLVVTPFATWIKSTIFKTDNSKNNFKFSRLA